MKNIFSKLLTLGRSKEQPDDVNSAKVDEIKRHEPCDFETAITETGFGKFNILLILIAMPSGWACMFESTSMSYVLPVAHCDLDISLQEKGYLISVTYLGMLSSAIIWGFLSDTLGRKKLLIAGFMMDAFFNILAGISQTYAMVLSAKFMGGFIINGPFAVLTTLLSEFHCAKYRARVLMFMGIVFSVANILLPLLGLGLLSQPIDWFIGEYFVIRTWNIYLLAASVPSLISGICHFFLPESPKFLMTTGRNDEALKVFQKVYAMNSGNPPESYPITKLVDETSDNDDMKGRSKWRAFKDGFGQMKPFFFTPYLARIILVCCIQVGSMMGLNTLRLWLPQLFSAINDFQATHNNTDSSMCEMLSMVRPGGISDAENEDCFVNYDNAFVYLNSMIVAVTSIIGYVFVGTLINALGKKRVFIGLGFIAGTCGLSIYFAQDSASTIALSSIYISLAGINTNVVLTIVVDLFPTRLRTMAVALVMMLGRSGAMVGNIIFPYLISLGCVPPFLFIGLSTLGCSLVAIILPKTDMKALE